MQIPFSFRAASRAALKAGKLIPRLSFQVKSPSFFSLRHASIGNETKSPHDWHCRFTVFAVLLASCAVVLCAVQGIFGYPFRKTIALGTTKFVPVEGSAYSAPLLAQYTPWGAQAASARLYEDTTVSSRYSQRATSVSGFGKGIFSFPEKGRLLFSASDNSDPRTNGRNYRIEVPRRVSKGVLPVCFIAWLMTVT